jgi:molybdenum cofactor cytidylyltransferase
LLVFKISVLYIKSKKIVALVLAAGESKRLGKPKQLLAYRNTTLLNHTKEQLTSDFVDRTFIVLGAYAKDILATLKFDNTSVINFEGWKEGMGSSLSFACSEIFKENSYDGILITLSDLPLVNKQDYIKMIELFESSNDIVATKANNSLGVPAIFGSDYFDELLALKGEKGAKPIVSKYKDRVKVFENKKAAIDIDTLEDYNGLHIGT